MSSVRITYKEPEDRPIQKVEWMWDGRKYTAFVEGRSLNISTDPGPEVRLCLSEAPEAIRAIFKMVEQRHA